MNTVEVIDNYEPVRDSTRTEKARLVATVTKPQKRLADAQAKSKTAIDPSYARLAYTLGKKLDAAKDKVIAFDKKHRELDARQSSAAAKAAQKETRKAAKYFEEKLTAFAASASALKDSAGALADTLQIRDPGIWCSRQTVDAAIRGRVIEILGAYAGIKLDGFGSFAKPSESLSTRFESQQGK